MNIRARKAGKGDPRDLPLEVRVLRARASAAEQRCEALEAKLAEQRADFEKREERWRTQARMALRFRCQLNALH